MAKRTRARASRARKTRPHRHNAVRQRRARATPCPPQSRSRHCTPRAATATRPSCWPTAAAATKKPTRRWPTSPPTSAVPRPPSSAWPTARAGCATSPRRAIWCRRRGSKRRPRRCRRRGEGEAPLDIAPRGRAACSGWSRRRSRRPRRCATSLRRRPRRTLDAQRTASTPQEPRGHLAQPRAAAEPAFHHTGQDDDDIPRDLDALRDALAQRIEAFMASRGRRGLFWTRMTAPAADRPVEWTSPRSRIAHQEPPRCRRKRRALDLLADAGRARRRQDAARRRVGAGARRRRHALRRDARLQHRAGRRDRARRARGDDRGAGGPARASRRSAERPQWTATRRRLEWPNGATAYAFSAEDPEQLRGPQFDAAWCDELAKWKHPDATFDMLQFGLRLGARPRQLITTTPRPIALIKRLVADPRTALTRAATQANKAFLSPAFLDEILARYAGTRLGRQEIDGEIIEERPDALWTRAMIEAGARRDGAAACAHRRRHRPAGVGARTAPTAAASSPRGLPKAASSTCWRTRACRASRPPAGRPRRSRFTGGTRPTRWWPRSTRAATWCARCCARSIAAAPVRSVHATRGKWLRAEPVAMHYAQGKVKHVGAGFAALEDEMCDFGLEGLSSRRLARPARCAGLGGDGADGEGGAAGAADQDSVGRAAGAAGDFAAVAVRAGSLFFSRGILHLIVV